MSPHRKEDDFRIDRAGGSIEQASATRRVHANDVGRFSKWIGNDATIFHEPASVVNFFGNLARSPAKFGRCQVISCLLKCGHDSSRHLLNVVRGSFDISTVLDTRCGMSVSCRGQNMVCRDAANFGRSTFGFVEQGSRNQATVDGYESQPSFAIIQNQRPSIESVPGVPGKSFAERTDQFDRPLLRSDVSSRRSGTKWMRVRSLRRRHGFNEQKGYCRKYEKDSHDRIPGQIGGWRARMRSIVNRITPQAFYPIARGRRFAAHPWFVSLRKFTPQGFDNLCFWCGTPSAFGSD